MIADKCRNTIKQRSPKQNEFERELDNFNGTDHWYKHWTGRLIYTDGIMYIAEKAGAYWLIDAIASWQPKALKMPQSKSGNSLSDFQLWKLDVFEDIAAILACLYDTDEPAFEQVIEFTDFPMNHIKLYVENETLCLPSER